ncbi:hypothetical protein O6P43_032609 [Quillaja saponaria]|uniref:Uncharacterized protein n=1 Tax=Quillaja saponaria TaxID=32244 RepID=A0AAD7P5R8_QUISA|nr:hypothetical protein O6P43_032609 [Quillaja saponaria]
MIFENISPPHCFMLCDTFAFLVHYFSISSREFTGRVAMLRSLVNHCTLSLLVCAIVAILGWDGCDSLVG